MDHNKQADILGCLIDIVTEEQALDRIELMVEQEALAHIITLNAEIVYQAQYNAELKEVIKQADMVTPDGIGIVWGAKKLGYDINERVTGIDLLYALSQRASQKGWKIYLLGAEPGVADQAAINLQKSYTGLNICGIHDGYFSTEEAEKIIDEIRRIKPQILLVALGAPNQEFWINKNKDKMGVPVSIGVGGSFDVIAGKKKRAPYWMIRLNLEWFYRLLSEPERIGRQMALPKFATRILIEKFNRR